ncbi:branched-chain amino acid ABC transporter permease [Hydrogenophaga electricum]|uniref:Branched-chain amino acid ABC transporter permease n=2 Tax=Comamonadaceae TaxID=80864 RepID=A0ABQ6C534_9BURK|nr:branched-chain amino acid ABC transporter permease [Hydrogenophaga electricum]
MTMRGLLRSFVVAGAVAVSGVLGATAAHALTPEDALVLASGASDERIDALNRLAAEDDPRALALINALADDAVKFQGEQVLIVQADGSAIDAVTGEPAPVREEAEDALLNNRMRGALATAKAGHDLFEDDAARQVAAAQVVLRGAVEDADDSGLPLLEKALAQPTLAAAARASLEQARSILQLASDDDAVRLSAARVLADKAPPSLRPMLAERLDAESNPDVKKALSDAIAALDSARALASGVSQAFTGISLGSILLLAALGLAITYGLMGVINMAHGELIMIGAYATWLVQSFFRSALPGWFDWYLLAAVPVAFITSALVGAVMERTVIRFLYGRPLETLLATWGISLVLMQSVRSLFGAQNVGVENPSWMSGSLTFMNGLVTLPWNRILIIVFAAGVLLGVVLLIGRTRLGLFVRGVTQNRPIASCMGVNTARIDTYAFALGSGIAGLAGCALSQVGNVGPDLGQGYIVDSFMVVVLGGVGQIAGTVYAALGLGLVNKFLEGWAGAVLAKIAVLVFIIVFIQKRPQGIFAFKGREV